MPHNLKAYRIFIASPGGLERERNGFREVVEEYNLSCARKRGVVFEPVGWEITLAGKGRPQELINEDVRSCDYFIMVLHDRWGRATDAGPNPKFRSGTHEEFCVACECYDQDEWPMRQIVLMFRAIDPGKLADPGPELQQVLEFRLRVENERQLLFNTFDNDRLFEKLVRRQLDQWIIDHERGRTLDKVGPLPPFRLTANSSLDHIQDIEFGEVSPDNELLEKAQRLADEGRLIEAETLFAEAIVGKSDPSALNRYGNFLSRLGRLDQAAVMYRRLAELGDLTGNYAASAIGYGNLGVIFRKRGELDRAEDMQRKALDIHQSIGWKAGMAKAYGNLGIIYRKRRQLNKAIDMHRKALIINEQLGRKDGIAIEYANLGGVYLVLRDFDRSATMLRKALDMEVMIGRKKGIAGGYGNLGSLYQKVGDLDRAEEMLRKALEINEQLGRKEGVATQCKVAGRIFRQRGEYRMAHQYWVRSRDLFAEMGIPHMVQKVQDLIDGLPNGAKGK